MDKQENKHLNNIDEISKILDEIRFKVSFVIENRVEEIPSKNTTSSESVLAGRLLELKQKAKGLFDSISV